MKKKTDVYHSQSLAGLQTWLYLQTLSAMTMALQRPMLPLPTAEALSIPGEHSGAS